MTAELLPLFPLGTVLVPGQALPLHIFEPRYRQLVTDLMAAPDDDRLGRAFGVVAIREGHEVGDHGARTLHPVGTTARLQTVERYEDGRFDLMTIGEHRFELLDVHHDQPYTTASVQWLPELPGEGASRLALTARERFIDYRDRMAAAGILDDLDDDDLPDEPRSLSYAITAGVLLDLSDRQRLLAQSTDADRLREALGLLRRETTLAQIIPSLPAGDLARTSVSLN